MSWLEQLKGDPLPWLLTDNEPGVRYLALRDLLDVPATESDYIAAQEEAHRQGPISLIMEQMEESGYWVEAGPGYRPKYRSTVWSVIMLAQLGASAALEAFTASLDRTLTNVLNELPSELYAGRTSFLNILPITEADIEERRGYAVLLSSIYARPVKIWQRA